MNDGTEVVVGGQLQLKKSFKNQKHEVKFVAPCFSYSSWKVKAAVRIFCRHLFSKAASANHLSSYCISGPVQQFWKILNQMDRSNGEFCV